MYQQVGLKKTLAYNSAATRLGLKIQRETFMPHERRNVFVPLLSILFQVLEKLHIHSTLGDLSDNSIVLLAPRYLVYQRANECFIVSWIRSEHHHFLGGRHFDLCSVVSGNLWC
jgi:hypothetical protein